MWGHAVRRSYYTSSKWHRIDPESVEYRDVDIGYWNKPKIVQRPFAKVTCGSNGTDSYWGQKIQVDIKDKIDIMRSGVCAYCRKRTLKEQGLEAKLEV